MKKKTEEDIIVVGTEKIPTEIIADSIVRISAAAEKLMASGLNRRALEVLLKDATQISMSAIGRVLNGLTRLSELYVTQKAATKRGK